MASKIDSDELRLVIGTILSIRVWGVMIGTCGPSKGGQVDIAIDAGRMDQWLQQRIVRFHTGNLKGLVSYMRCGKFNPRG